MTAIATVTRMGRDSLLARGAKRLGREPKASPNHPNPENPHA